MEQFLTFTIAGLVTAALYAVAASGLVLTYTTSGVFNFAHGAFGMFAAFAYWQVRHEWGVPAPIALVIVLFIGAPIFGAVVERVILRGLRGTSEVIRLIVSVSLLFGVYQAAVLLFPPGIGRRMPGFFDGESIDLGVVNLTWHDATTVLAAVVTAVVLRVMLFRTRLGVSMRGVVDDPDLLRLTGGRPDRAAMYSWSIGTSLAALAGILLAGSQGSLSHIPLTLLVVNAYAAALFGRLKSLTLTFVGALVIGLTESYAIGYLDLSQPFSSIGGLTISPPLSLAGLRPAIPVILLFLVLLFLPPLRLRAGGQQQSREEIPAPPVRRWIIAVVPVGLLCVAAGALLPSLRTFQLGQGLALSIVMLSLVPLIGYAGQISLAPMAFAGIGAVAMGAWGGDGNPLALVAVVAVSAAAGVAVALPALRLQGLYLALGTAAFAVVMDQLFFNQNLFLPNGNRAVPRVDLGPVSTDSDTAHLVFLGIVFCLVATLVVAIRGSEYGRRLLAMKSSPSACATLGVNLTSTKLSVFALSAGIAGLGGALYGAQLRSVGPTTFQFLQSLPIVLLAVIGGIGGVGGALFGGIVYALSFLILPELVPSLRTVLTLGPALAGVSLGRNPNGAVHETVRSIRQRRSAGDGAPPADPRSSVALERMGIDGFSEADRAMLDRALGVTVRT
ncbi:branched-chain amino acid ABC transporter permease [Actinospongicola halichondriae]|uniref:branched-chain amino acid ABC transporter permease n=1 Tax=Actinospongicola halichondriae TaxID=3236844 RepID=UPI003D51A8CA